jgi:hypothetical protein
MTQGITRLSLGNPTRMADKLSDPFYREYQDKKKIEFIEFISKLPFKDFDILQPIDHLNESYRIRIKYKTNVIPVEFYDAIRKKYKKISIIRHSDGMEYFLLPFAPVSRITRQTWFILLLFLIMIVCLYIQLINKPSRYGWLFTHDIITQKITF